MIVNFISFWLEKKILSQDIIYVKYFESDFNFKSDLSMLSTARRGKAHLAVSYNSINQPIKIERVSSSGVTKKLEMLKGFCIYNIENKANETYKQIDLVYDNQLIAIKK